MGSLSNYSENKLTDHVLGTTVYVPSTALHLALSTTDPDDDITQLTEPVGGSYARRPIVFGAEAARTISQNALITYALSSAAWGTVTHWAIMDALSGGNMLAHGSFDTSYVIGSGKIFSVATNQVKVSINTGAWSNYLVNKALDFMFRNQAFAQPTIYAALVETTHVVDSDTGITIDELDMGDYAREAHSAWDAAVNGVSQNTGIISFGVLTGTGETVTAACLTDNASKGSGNLLMYDNALDMAIATDEEVEFAEGDFTASLS